jgi:hypothetical protein
VKRYTGIPLALFSTTVAYAGVFLAPAAPVWADDLPSGIFAVNTDGEASAWTVESDCTPSCVARIVSSQGWRGYAALRAGRWTMTVYLGNWMRSSYPANPITCISNDNASAVTQTWIWDGVTLEGTVETIRRDRCGGLPIREQAPVVLMRTAQHPDDGVAQR